MSRHPTSAELTGFADGELPAEARARVARHLEECPECRGTISAHRALGEEVRALPPEPLAPEVKDRVMASLTAGTKVVLPLPTRGGAIRWRPRAAWVAAAAALVVGVALTIRAPELASESSELTFTPAQPQPGEEILVEYRSSGRFAGYDRLVLRGRFRQARGPADRGPLTQLVVTRVERGRGGRFYGTFTLPPDIVYGAFAVEDESGEVLDTNNGALWEVVAHHEGVPPYEGLIQQFLDVEIRDRARSVSLAQRMTELYPGRAEAWALLSSAEGFHWGQSPPDSISRRQHDRFRTLDSVLTRADGLPATDLLGMFGYASGLGDSEAASRWVERILRDAPASNAAATMRVMNAGTPASRLASLEEWWQNRIGPDRSLLETGMFFAGLTGDADAAVRWAERIVLFDPTAWPGLVTALLNVPSSVEVAIVRAREYMAAAPLSDAKNRLLRERASEHARRVALRQGRIHAAIGRAMIAQESLPGGIAALEQAASAGWDSDVFADLATASFEAGDSARSAEMLARVAVDPVASAAKRDSATREARRYVDESEWSGLVGDARGAMFGRVLADQQAGPTVPESATWRDPAGVSHAIRDILSGQVTLATFWWAQPSPALRGVAEQIAALGGQTVAVAIGDRPPAVTGAPDTGLGGIPLFHDVRGDENRGFDIIGYPSYVIIDHNGRVRFTSFPGSGGWRTAVRRVAVLIGVQGNSTIADR